MAGKAVKYCVVDAFTESAFKGNPAVVCMLEDTKSDEWLQAVASEFNLSETCYLTRIVDSDPDIRCPKFRLRWFTPKAEVDLCGHATLAAAHVLFTYYVTDSDKVEFLTLSGILTAKKMLEEGSKNGNAQASFYIELDFPVVPITECNFAETSAVSKSLNDSFVVEIQKTTTNEDLFVVLPSDKDVAEVEPQFDKIREFPARGMIITGPAPPGSEFDFYSRFFCPKLGINEDPVCGSAHCALAPYWSKKLGKCDFVAYVASPRSGVVNIHLDEQSERVYLRGKATLVAEGCLLV